MCIRHHSTRDTRVSFSSFVPQTVSDTLALGDDMKRHFSPRTRFSGWRQLWVWLAEAEKGTALVLVIRASRLTYNRAWSSNSRRCYRTDESQCGNQRRRIFFGRRGREKAEARCYGPCTHLRPSRASRSGLYPLGRNFLLLTDNGDLINMKNGLNLLLPKLARVIYKLTSFAKQYKDLACLGITHGQPAQLTTVGKRACVWIQDLLMDVRNLERARDDIRFRGVKGTTGTQASLQIFNNDHDKVDRLDELVTEKAGFESAFTITSQTYSRKIDVDILNALGSFGATCERIGGDFRHLAMFKELEEPLEKDQIGSSAMVLSSLCYYRQNTDVELGL
jgi:adenylosuccinate lyase